MAASCRLINFPNKFVHNIFRSRNPQSFHRLLCTTRFQTNRVLVTSFRKTILENKSKFTILKQIRREFRTKNSKNKNEVKRKSSNKSNFSSLARPFVFTVGVCSCSFLGAMIWQYEKLRGIFKQSRSNTGDRPVHKKEFDLRQHMNSLWSSMSTGDKVAFGIIAANVVVFGLWRVSPLQPFMLRYFTSAPKHPSPSLLLSTFSHINVFHIAVNMYVLHSFANACLPTFGPEQFAAFYLSAGTFASFASLASKVFLKQVNPSVGASGAIMALIGVVATHYPNAQLSLAFVDFIFPHSFSAQTGVMAIVALDAAGLLLGWKLFDHAGHLGGMLFGILYAKYGEKLIWKNREKVIKVWHSMRGKP